MSFHQGPEDRGVQSRIVAVCQTALIWLWVFMLSIVGVHAEVSDSSDVDLRFYGHVSAKLAVNDSTFVCDDERKADILLGKLLADLFWDKDDSCQTKSAPVAGQSIRFYSWNPYGVVWIGRLGNRVLIRGAADETALLARLGRESIDWKQVKYDPLQAYPIALDFYDLRAFKFYTHAMTSARKMGLENHWPFVEKFGLGGMAFQTTPLHPAKGVWGWTMTDYEVAAAEKEKGLIGIALDVSATSPLWVYNSFHNEMMQGDPGILFGAWNGAGPAGEHFRSWGAGSELRREMVDSTIRQIMERYGASPSVGGWHVYAGGPGAEMALHNLSTTLWDYSPAGQKWFCEWLRDIRKLSLAELGERWYGDPTHFKNWEQVQVPGQADFYGNIGWEGYRIREGWQWMKADDSAGATAPGFGDSRWLSFRMPPSADQDFLTWVPAWYQTSFDVTDWLRKQSGKEIYLIFGVNGINATSRDASEIWLNGKRIGAFPPNSAYLGSVSLPVTRFLIAGKNEILIKVGKDGKIYQPPVLTTSQARYPYLGREGNARYYDLKEWQAYSLYREHVLALDIVRSIDPDRPLILSPGCTHAIADYAADLCVRYGMGMQDTGRETSERPWWPRLGFLNGFYGTAESGSTVRGRNLDRFRGWLLINGESNVDFFWDIEDYMQEEQSTGWFTKNARLLRLIGKALPEKPEVVMFRSAKSELMGCGLWTKDLGRGELQGAHYDFMVATEREIRNESICDYKVMWDVGSEFMDEDLVAAIRKYVQGGGIFVAYSSTGRHSFLEGDSQPISKLTGCRVDERTDESKLKFEQAQTVLKGWEGREFPAKGSKLTPVANDVVPLARWSDGSLAIARRKLGKGRVIVLGSDFWRGTRDMDGARRVDNPLEFEFIEKMLSGLGVSRVCEADKPTVWTRTFIGKNGLQKWLLAYNAEDKPTRALLKFQVDRKPEILWDLISNQPVNFSYANGWVSIADVAFDGYGNRVFAVPYNQLGGGVQVWWQEKIKYWGKSRQPTKDFGQLLEPTVSADTLPFAKFRFIADKDGRISQGSEWLAEKYDDSSWKEMKAGIWNYLDEDLKDYSGKGLYRRKFIIPSTWTGRRILLNLYNFDTPIIRDQGVFYINGKKVVTYQAATWIQLRNYDVTDVLLAGENTLAIEVTGGKPWGGIAGCIWLEPLKKIASKIDLAGSWDVVGGDFTRRTSVTMPGRATGKYVVRKVNIPADWKGQQIYIQFQTPVQWVAAVKVNGKPICYDAPLHPYGLYSEVNLTTMLVPGEENEIELWPYQTIPHPGKNEKPEVGMELKAVSIGCVDK
jgi:hypothetical protein